MVVLEEKIYTVEEYLELEKTSEIRHEFVYGKRIPMSGESKNANDIALNCTFLLRQVAAAKGFKTYMESVKVQVDAAGLYRYPDVVVTPKSDDADTYLVTQAILLIEITSEHSAGRDQKIKLREYTHLKSLQHYLIIDQYEMLVESYRREEANWIYEVFDQPEAQIYFLFLDLKISLKAIYEGVTLPEKF